MEKRMKRLKVIFALAAVCGLMAGCQVGTKEGQGGNISTQVMEADKEVTAYEQVTETETETESAAASYEWTEFIVNGKTYQLPLNFKELETEGWTIEGSGSDSILEPGVGKPVMLSNKNESYDRGVMIVADIRNSSDEALAIEECDVYTFGIDIFAAQENYPEMSLGNGLTLGSSKSEVEQVYGPCDDISEFEGRTRYAYSMGDSGRVMVMFNDEEKVAGLELYLIKR